jgi:predicted enzyme related to lactoylglutathione lyase
MNEPTGGVEPQAAQPEDSDETLRESSSTRTFPLIRKVDAVTIPVPDLDSGLRFYRDELGHALLWRNDALAQAGLALPDSDTEIVLTTRLDYAPNWLVISADEAADAIRAAGGRVVTEPFDTPVGRAVVVADSFDNVLVMLDLSKGTYTTDETAAVTGVS